jgi:hypothetical protein
LKVEGDPMALMQLRDFFEVATPDFPIMSPRPAG